jgi:hypothetical protein
MPMMETAKAAESVVTPYPMTLPENPPAPGALVHLRSRRWLVEEVVAPARPGQSSLVRLACADDDAQGQTLDVFWDYEIDRQILEEEGWRDLAAKGFDAPRQYEIWARFFGSSMKDDLRYTPSDCFETFPFPEGFKTHPALEAAGRAYHDFRAAPMVRNDEGLTKTYNRFNDPDEPDPEIAKLRDLHAAMDRAVLDAYGWTDLHPTCDFLLDYEIDEEQWGTKENPYRYRWPAPLHDEVLARLLDLNTTRAAAETRSGAAPTNKRVGKQAAKRTRGGPDTGDLFP